MTKIMTSFSGDSEKADGLLQAPRGILESLNSAMQPMCLEAAGRCTVIHDCVIMGVANPFILRYVSNSDPAGRRG